MVSFKRRGLADHDEQDPHRLLRDTRPLGQRFFEDFLHNPTAMALFVLLVGVGGVLFPEFADIGFLAALLGFSISYRHRGTLPFRLPKRALTTDHNDLSPGVLRKPNPARGIAFLGNDLDTSQELWFNNDDMRTHLLLFGSTGSGKTETLISLVLNSLIWGSGFIYVDGKGDNTLYARLFSMVRRVGREDDMLVINFMTGARDIVGPQERRLSNTMNPFAIGSSSMLSQLVVSLMDSSSESSDGDMWKGRAIAFVEALMKVLVYARDEELILLDANTIRYYFMLDKLEPIILDRVLLRYNQEPASLADAPDVVIEPIMNYMYNLPGYNKEKRGKHVSQVLEQHGFITMQLTRVFTSLADTYGHILRTRLAEVDVRDVVLNRRILVVLLPALEKSPDELAALGKVIVASLKSMMASGLGEDVEGEYRDLILRKPTNALTPFLCVLDEYGYYAVPGFAVVPAQARSLGFSAIFAGQDLPAFQKASKEEAASIGANTNIKICMKLEDPIETWEFFSKTAGEAYVTKVDHFQTKAQSMTNSYLDTKSASFERRARIDLLDLKDQNVGEMHIFFASKIVRARSFYANPNPVARMKINHFLRVEKPKSLFLHEFTKRLEQFLMLQVEKDFFSQVQVDSEDIMRVADGMVQAGDAEPVQKALQVLKQFQKKAEPLRGVETTERLSKRELNVFTELRSKNFADSELLCSDLESFAHPILLNHEVLLGLETLELNAGRTERHSRNIAEELMKDMRLASHYPPSSFEQPVASELTHIVDQLIVYFEGD